MDFCKNHIRTAYHPASHHVFRKRSIAPALISLFSRHLHTVRCINRYRPTECFENRDGSEIYYQIIVPKGSTTFGQDDLITAKRNQFFFNISHFLW